MSIISETILNFLELLFPQSVTNLGPGFYGLLGFFGLYFVLLLVWHLLFKPMLKAFKII